VKVNIERNSSPHLGLPQLLMGQVWDEQTLEAHSLIKQQWHTALSGGIVRRSNS